MKYEIFQIIVNNKNYFSMNFINIITKNYLKIKLDERKNSFTLSSLLQFLHGGFN